MSEDPITRHEFDLFQVHIDGRLVDISKSLEAMWKKIDGRPSWGVVFAITTLSSLVVGMAVKILFGG